MEILTVKLQGNGYLLNGSMSVPKADGNREYEAIKEWLAKGNEPEPQFSKKELKEQKLQKEKQEAQEYLLSTDYINNKYNEEVLIAGTMTEEDFVIKYSFVLQKRAECRALLSSE